MQKSVKFLLMGAIFKTDKTNKMKQYNKTYLPDAITYNGNEYKANAQG